MADRRALQKLEDQLKCSICLDTYTDPKLLQCFHVNCQTCLVRLVVRDQQGQFTLTCPICRQVTPVPASGVAGLQPAFHINNLLDIMEERKKDQPTAKKQVETTSSPRRKIPQCSEHNGKAELFCETCGALLCLRCVIKGGRHHDHDHQLLGEAFEKFKEEISRSLQPMEKQVAVIDKALKWLDARRGEISNQQEVIEADIHDDFKRLHSILHVRKTELISQLHQITQRKLKDLAVQRDQIETTLAQLSSCLDFMKESLKTSSEAEVLMMKPTIVKQVKELTTTFQPDMLKPDTEADMIFSALADISATCENYGQVSASSLPDPSKCYVSVMDTEVSVGETATAVLQAISYQGQSCTEADRSFECELVSEITGARARGSVERRGQSQYEISYQPTIKGRHQLHIKVEGQHIRASPFDIAAKLPVEKISTPILTIDPLANPRGVAINQRGEVVVTEMDKHCVSVFSPSGEKLRSFGTHGSGEGQFEDPCGVAVDGEGNILVVDSHKCRIQKFTPEGQPLAAVGTKGHGQLQFSYPRGIAYNHSNSKVYVTDENSRIQVLNSDLTFSSSFGKQGSDIGEFNTPWGVACDSAGNVYVADSGNNRVQVFTAEGKFLRVFGRVMWPADITTDNTGLIYVSELDNHRVSVFDSECRLVASFGREGEGPGELKYPIGVFVDDSGVVYVCDSSNERLQMF